MTTVLLSLPELTTKLGSDKHHENDKIPPKWISLNVATGYDGFLKSQIFIAGF